MMSSEDTELATLAGGCFWCTEAIFQRLKGVISVMPGYAGGTVESPTYEQVCTGTTGHAEAIQITFDPNEISYKKILEVFFHLHDPTTLNQQGNDFGTQYRSAIFYNTEEQKSIAEKLKTLHYLLHGKAVFRRPDVFAIDVGKCTKKVYSWL